MKAIEENDEKEEWNEEEKEGKNDDNDIDEDIIACKIGFSDDLIDINFVKEEVEEGKYGDSIYTVNSNMTDKYLYKSDIHGIEKWEYLDNWYDFVEEDIKYHSDDFPYLIGPLFNETFGNIPRLQNEISENIQELEDESSENI